MKPITEYKTPEQKHFEEMAAIVVKLISELPEIDRKEIYNFILYKYNENK